MAAEQKALDQRDGAAVGRVGLEAGLPQQVARDHAVHDPQHGHHQLLLCSQQQAQRDRQRQHSLTMAPCNVRVTVDKAKVTATDIVAENGFIHVIESVVLPQ